MSQAHLFVIGLLLAWMAGIRAYLTVFGVGLAGLLGWVELPAALQPTQSWWVLGTLIGAVVGAQSQITLAGLDFVLASLFAVLTVEQWRTKKSPAPLWVALAAYAVAYPLAARHALVIAIALSIAAGMLWKSKSAAAGEQA